jgi:predicted esterase
VTASNEHADANTLTQRTITVTRTARYFVRGPIGRATTDVWVALHGYAQLASAFAETAQWPAASHRAYVFPEALQRFYDSDYRTPGANAAAPVVASWMTREARDDDIADNQAYLDAVWAEVRADAPNAALTVLGFSQGGATASRWAALRSARGDPPRRLIMWGSALAPEIALGAGAPLLRVPVVLVRGTTDRWATPNRIADERARLDAAGFPYEVRTFDGGHRLDDAVLGELAG